MRKMTAGELKHAVRLLLTGRDFLSRVPYLSVDETKSKQFSQLQELVTSAYQNGSVLSKSV